MHHVDMYALPLLTLFSGVFFSVFHSVSIFNFILQCRAGAVFFICLSRWSLALFWDGINNKPYISRNWFARVESEVQMSFSYVKVFKLTLFCTLRGFHTMNEKQMEQGKKWEKCGNEENVEMCKDVFTPFPFYNQSNHKMHSINSVTLFFCLAKISSLDFEVNLTDIYAKKIALTIVLIVVAWRCNLTVTR